MGDEHFLIPTLSRSKIPHLLSYPIGAEAISTALTTVPQAAHLKLHFFFWSDFHLRQGRYEFLRVEYRNGVDPVEQHLFDNLYGRPPQWVWEIVVLPVPRVFRHRVKQYILTTALQEMADWLHHLGSLTQKGSAVLSFFYDEKGDEYIARPIERLEPAR